MGSETEGKGYTIAKWGIGIGLAWLLSPIILGAVKGILGLVICVAVGTVAIQVWPFFQFLIKNAVINLFKWTARRDPIGSAQNIEIEKTKELEVYREETTSIDADTRSFERMVLDAEQQYPDDQETARLREQLNMLKDTVADRRQNEVEYEKALTAYRAGIKKMQVMWSAAQVGNKASQRANMSSKQYQRLVAETAFDTVQKGMDQMSARLAESRARAEAQKAALPPRRTIPMGNVVDVSAKQPVFKGRSES